MADVLASIGKVVTPDGVVDAPPPTADKPPVAEPAPKVSRRLGESVVQMQDSAAKPKPADAPATPPPATPPAAPVTPPATPPPAEPPKPPTPAPALRKKEPVTAAPPVAPLPAPAPAPQPAPVAAAPAPVADPDADYISGLSQDQRDELELAEFAGTKNPDFKTKRAETLAYFKKVDAFVTANPGFTPDSTEFKDFVTANKPAFPGRRKIENQFVAAQASKTAREEVLAEVKPQLEAAQKKLREQELAPIVEKAINEFRDVLSSTEILPPDANMVPLPKEVGDKLRDGGYAAAFEEYPIETPIFHSAANAAREWMRLTTGQTPFDPNNKMHTWLVDFVGQQGAIYARGPQATRPDGKRFMPWMDFIQLTDRNQIAQHYTFNDNQVLDMIAVNANISYNQQLQRLEKAGFKRETKKTLPNPPNPTPTPAPAKAPESPPAPPSPRITGSTLPGPGTPAKNANPNATFLNDLVPGSAEKLGVA